jgi:hypothetical protein
MTINAIQTGTSRIFTSNAEGFYHAPFLLYSPRNRQIQVSPGLPG